MARTKDIETRNTVLINMLDEDEGQSRTDLNLSVFLLRDLVAAGHVKEVGVRKRTDENGNGMRGRPVKLYKLTPNGRKAAKRRKAKIVAEATAETTSEPIAA